MSDAVPPGPDRIAVPPGPDRIAVPPCPEGPRSGLGPDLARFAAVVAATAVGRSLGGDDVAWSLVAGTSSGAVALWLVGRGRLAAEPIAVREVLGWTAVVVAQDLAFDLMTWAMGHPQLEPGWAEIVAGASVPVLALTLVVVSVFEELLFRGLLQGTLARTRLGPMGALVATALLFTAAHGADDALRAAEVFTGALLLGEARRRTGSAVPGMLPHALGNLKVVGTALWG